MGLRSQKKTLNLHPTEIPWMGSSQQSPHWGQLGLLVYLPSAKAGLLRSLGAISLFLQTHPNSDPCLSETAGEPPPGDC